MFHRGHVPCLGATPSVSLDDAADRSGVPVGDGEGQRTLAGLAYDDDVNETQHVEKWHAVAYIAYSVQSLQHALDKVLAGRDRDRLVPPVHLKHDTLLACQMEDLRDGRDSRVSEGHAVPA